MLYWTGHDWGADRQHSPGEPTKSTEPAVSAGLCPALWFSEALSAAGLLPRFFVPRVLMQAGHADTRTHACTHAHKHTHTYGVHMYIPWPPSWCMGTRLGFWPLLAGMLPSRTMACGKESHLLPDENAVPCEPGCEIPNPVTHPWPVARGGASIFSFLTYHIGHEKPTYPSYPKVPTPPQAISLDPHFPAISAAACDIQLTHPAHPAPT